METTNETTNETKNEITQQQQQQIWGDLDKGLAGLVPMKQQGGRKIALIKLFRQVFNTDLKAAKIFLETLNEVWVGPAPAPAPNTYQEGLLLDLKAEHERAGRFEKSLMDANRGMDHYRSEAVRLSSLAQDMKSVIHNLLANITTEVAPVDREGRRP